MATKALVALKVSASGIPVITKVGRAFEGTSKKVSAFRKALGSTGSVLGRFGGGVRSFVSGPLSVLKRGMGGLGSVVGKLAMGPFRLLKGMFGLVGGAFMSLVNLIRAHPLITLIGGYLAINTIRSVAASVLEGARVQEEAMKRVESAVVSQGVQWGVYEKRVVSATTALQRKTLFGDEAQLVALGELVTILGSVTGALKVLPVVLDVSARHGLDLASMSRAIGLAMKGDIALIGRYVPALRGLSEEQKTVTNITRILKETYAGTAEILAKTSSGALKQLSNAWGDVKETLGFVVQDALAPLARSFTQNLYGINDWIAAVHEGRRTWMEFATVLTSWLGGVAVRMKDSFAQIWLPSFVKIGRDLWGAIGKGVHFLLGEVRSGLGKAVSFMGSKLKQAAPAIIKKFGNVLSDAIPYFAGIGKEIGTAIASGWPIFVRGAKGVWKEVYPIMVTGARKTQEFFTATVVPFLEAGKDWGLALAKGLTTEFLKFMGNHPFLPIAMGALAGSRFGVPGAVAGAGAGMLGGMHIAGQGLDALESIEATQAERGIARNRQRGIWAGADPATRRALRKSGELNLLPPSIDEIASDVFGDLGSSPITPKVPKSLGVPPQTARKRSPVQEALLNKGFTKSELEAGGFTGGPSTSLDMRRELMDALRQAEAERPIARLSSPAAQASEITRQGQEAQMLSELRNIAKGIDALVANTSPSSPSNMARIPVV